MRRSNNKRLLVQNQRAFFIIIGCRVLSFVTEPVRDDLKSPFRNIILKEFVFSKAQGQSISASCSSTSRPVGSGFCLFPPNSSAFRLTPDATGGRINKGPPQVQLRVLLQDYLVGRIAENGRREKIFWVRI